MKIKAGRGLMGILLGVAGGMVGGALAYVGALPVWRDRAAHQKFQSVVSTPFMTKVAKTAAEYQMGASVLESVVTEVVGRLPNCDGSALDYKDLNPVTAIPPGYSLEKHPSSCEINVQVDLNGIKAVHVNKVGIVSEIELKGGERLQRKELSPHVTVYLLPLCPIVGFLLAWGCHRRLTRVPTAPAAPPG